MKRVLQIMGGLNRGGLETFVMNMYRSIDRDEIQFDFLLTQQSGGDYAEEAISMGATIYTLPARNKGFFEYEKAISIFFEKHASQYVACHMHTSSLSSISPLKYAKKYGIPVRVLHSHNSTISRDLKFRFLHITLHYLHKPVVKKWATHYLGCSDKALDWLYKYTGVRQKARMCNNGIDVDRYAYNEEKRNIIRKQFNINYKELLIGHVGRFEQVKNQSFLIDILYYLLKDGYKAKLMLVGTGKLLDTVKQQAIEKEIVDSVIFTGIRSDVNLLMLSMDVFVMPSLFEGLPVTLVEAQSSGLPIVASDTISHDSDLSGTILFKSINDSAAEWAKCILEWREKLNKNNNIKSKTNGF